MKRFLAFLLTAAMLLALLPAVSAAEDPDHGSFETAQELTVNQTVTENLSDFDDLDYYRVELSQPGRLSLQFLHDYVESSVNGDTFWRVGLYRTEDTGGFSELVTYYLTGDNKGSECGSIGLPAGTYYILIRSNGTYFSSFSDTSYTLTADFEASEVWEKEPNEDSVHATELPLNTRFSGSLLDFEDRDYYKIEVTEPGRLSLLFRHDYVGSSANDAFWRVGLYRTEDTGGFSEMVSYDFTGADKGAGRGSIGLPKGTYYILVKGNGIYRSCFSDIPYALTADFEPSEVWEQEDNDDFPRATELPLNTRFSGSLMHFHDKDYYKFEVTEPGCLSLLFCHDYVDVPENKDVFWRVSLYRTEDTGGFSEMVSYDFTGADKGAERGSIGLPEGTYYILVKGNGTYFSCYSDTPYTLTAEFEPSEVWEQEVNDDFPQATELPLNTGFSGSLMHFRDQDYYKFEVTEPGPVRMTFSHEYFDSKDTYWAAYLYKADENGGHSEITSEDFPGSSTRTECKFSDLPAGVYYLLIKSNGSYSGSFSDTPYTVTLSTPHVCDGGPDCPSHSMKDVDKTQWYHESVDYVISHGLMGGTSLTTFEPHSTTTRAMVVTVLHRLSGDGNTDYKMTFRDVPEGQWYTEAIRWGAKNRIVGGHTPWKFSPDDPVTREQMAAILYRYADYKGYDVSARADLSGFRDVRDISFWALANMQWANAEGLIGGMPDKTIDPTGDAERCQVAAILMRFCENIVNE